MLNTKSFEDLKIDEGLRLKPYLDTKGKLTIGFGRNLHDVGISKEEAGILFKNDVECAHKELMRFKWFQHLDHARKDVLINMCFNMGLSRLLKFKKMISALEQGKYEYASDEMLDSKWHKDVGKRAERLALTMRTGKI